MQKNIKSQVGSLFFKIEQNRFQILDRREILHQIGHLPEKFWFGSTPTSVRGWLVDFQLIDSSDLNVCADSTIYMWVDYNPNDSSSLTLYTDIL